MIIQKFGGVAMQNEQMRTYCINHIKKGIEQYGKIVVVVSAIGRFGDPYATDSLLNLTTAFTSDKAARDLIASCGELIAASVLSAELTHLGILNKVLHGQQAGILTSGQFGDASIIDIDTTTIRHVLNDTNCVIIPGFQGMDHYGNVMTLGRGGSDLTAVALGEALQASHVEFFKDVPGVMTGDPALVSNYQKLDTLTFDQFLQLLQCDKPIIQLRAALHAKKTTMPLYIRGIASIETGTWISP
ncbi:amino acid kinase family protein [Sporosarcina sp. G11-34]|uniref:amino acid kinase family protein n=1 Tax=Sporosarcina sp. G11-34 TaxID=2849605 RepID=UPI0022A9CB15|nr:aspartate kinase [Sporosarcina sp. G11-34]MCZ2257137.1 aspartate kinase [Sporosarcina sp. G11-34]